MFKRRQWVLLENIGSTDSWVCLIKSSEPNRQYSTVFYSCITFPLGKKEFVGRSWTHYHMNFGEGHKATHITKEVARIMVSSNVR